jgi:hypothetical protein
VSNKSVFSKGILNGLKGVTLTGGQKFPNSTFGEIELWKKLQKKEKKNIISEIINNNIPTFKPKKTFFECIPSEFASRTMSRHH